MGRDLFSLSARSLFLAQLHFAKYLWNLNSQYITISKLFTEALYLSSSVTIAFSWASD